MIPANLSPVANHLWQSTFFAAAVWLLTLALRKNRAAVRYGLWLAASVKFLIPFSLLVSAGMQAGWRTAPASAPAQIPVVMEEIAQPFAAATPAQRAAADPVPPVLFGVWVCGFAISVVWWAQCWVRMRAIRRTGQEACRTFEPGVFGIWKPVLLLPAGIQKRLTAAQLEAVIAHEMCHVRRRDNLTAAIHMVVEAVFWFHPLVWWIRERLVEERERACDEAVLRTAVDPQDYAEAILNVCKFYLESPLACVSGITGSNLKRRIEEILASRAACNLDWRRKLLLAALGAAAMVGPIAIGLVNAPPSAAQSQDSPAPAFEVASVKPNKSDSQRAPSMILPGGRFTATNNTVRALILNAYGIFTSPDLLSGGPAWIDSEKYDVDAKAGAGAIPAGASGQVLWTKTRLMLRTLLADRFHLAIRRETKEMPVYELVTARNGPKLRKAADQDCAASVTACHGFSGNPARMSGVAVDMSDLALLLSSYAGRTVLDKTGVQGLYDIKLQWNPFGDRAPSGEDVPRAPGAEAREGPRPDFSSLPSLFTALEQQLGLKLESRRGPVEVYVIDRVERPSEN
jgi:bla regulator protein blaR1